MLSAWSMQLARIMAVVLFILLVFLQIITVSRLQQEVGIVCGPTNYGDACLVEPTTSSVGMVVKPLGVNVLVGTANRLEVLRLHTDLLPVMTIHLNPDSQGNPNCVSDHSPTSECDNFIRIIQDFPSSNQVMLCGSNAFQPKCTLHNQSKLFSYRQLAVADGISPFRSEDPVVYVLGSNLGFFSYTRLKNSDFRLRKFIVANQTASLLATSGTTAFMNPSFISAYEHREHVYFFFNEEVDLHNVRRGTRHARVARICKMDNGPSPLSLSNVVDNNFLTLVKARLECSMGSTRPFIYDNLVATYLYRPPADPSSPILYGAFQPPHNGPKGAAICKYPLNSQVKGGASSVFESIMYQIQGFPHTAESFSCPPDRGPNFRPRDVQDATRFVLKQDPIFPAGRVPLLTLRDYITAIGVQMLVQGGNTLEVVYFANELGEVKQIVSGRVHTLYTPSVVRPVRELFLRYMSYNGITVLNIVVSVGNSVLRITRGRCGCYFTCFQCLFSGDVYCGWDASSGAGGACVYKFGRRRENLSESFSASAGDIAQICGVRDRLAPNPSRFCVPPRARSAAVVSTEAVESRANTNGMFLTIIISALLTQFAVVKL